MLLQPTSPLIDAEDIAACVRLAKSSVAEAVISVTRFDGHPSWLMAIEPDGRLVHWRAQEPHAERRQDGAVTYNLNGAIYLLTSELVRRGGNWYGNSTLAYEIPAQRSLEIDTPWDLHLVRLVFEDRARRAQDEQNTGILP